MRGAARGGLLPVATRGAEDEAFLLRFEDSIQFGYDLLAALVQLFFVLLVDIWVFLCCCAGNPSVHVADDDRWVEVPVFDWLGGEVLLQEFARSRWPSAVHALAETSWPQESCAKTCIPCRF